MPLLSVGELVWQCRAWKDHFPFARCSIRRSLRNFGDMHMISSAPKPIVLVADDELYLREVLQLILTRDGFETRLASNGQEATDIYRAHHHTIDVVLMDLHMPKIDGLAAFEIMREI